MQIEVAIAVLWRRDGGIVRVLATRRHPEVHLPGAWELPGGKIRPSETAPQAVRREVLEEIGVELEHVEPLIVVDHDYPDRSIRLHAFLAGVESPVQIHERGVDSHRWITLAEFEVWPFPEANQQVTSAAVSALRTC